MDMLTFALGFFCGAWITAIITIVVLIERIRGKLKDLTKRIVK